MYIIRGTETRTRPPWKALILEKKTPITLNSSTGTNTSAKAAKGNFYFLEGVLVWHRLSSFVSIHP